MIAEGARRIPLALAVVAVASTVRAPVTALSTALPDLDVSPLVRGVLSSAPAWCCGVAALITPRLTRRWGSQRLILVSVVVMAVALAWRVAGGGALLTGSVLAYSAAAVITIALPVHVRMEYGGRAGVMTAVAAAAISSGVAIAAVVTPTLTIWFHGWSVPVGAWSVVAGAAAALWCCAGPLPQHRAGHAGAICSTPDPRRPRSSSTPATRGRGLWCSPGAWILSVFFGLQSALSLTVLAWGVPILQHAGVSRQTAGVLVAVTMMVSIVAMLTLGAATNRARDQRPGLAVMTGCGAVGLAGLLVAPLHSPWIWSVFLGIGVSVLSVAVALPWHRSASPVTAMRLSAMMQGWGYCIAAAGPLLTSTLHAATGDFDLTLVILLAGAVLQAVLILPICAVRFDARREPAIANASAKQRSTMSDPHP